MKRKIYIFFEILTLVIVSLVLIERYDTNSSIPVFRLTFDDEGIIRKTTDILITILFLTRIVELLGIKIVNKKWDFNGLRFLFYLIFISPDIWLYIQWTYYVNTYWSLLVILMFPLIFWTFPALNSIQLTKNLERITQVKIVTISTFFILTTILTYLTLEKKEIETSRRNVTTERNNAP